MKRLSRLVLLLVLAAGALSGCVAYPAGYSYDYPGYYGYRPGVSVAVVAPCCGYGYGWHRWY